MDLLSYHSGTTMASAVFPCSGCELEVRPRQEALICDRCNKWCHRLCGTELSQSESRYFNWRLKAGEVFIWCCPDCPDWKEVTGTISFLFVRGLHERERERERLSTVNCELCELCELWTRCILHILGVLTNAQFGLITMQKGGTMQLTG